MSFFMRFLICVSFIVSIYCVHAKELRTIFGLFEEKDPLVMELIEAPVMQRMLHVDQSGVVYHLGYTAAFSRYSHCLGVYHLLKKVQAPYKEQVAGLLHDVSHTVFSHLGDFLFLKDHRKDSYQDSIHGWYLQQLGCGEILKKYGISLPEVFIEEGRFLALDQDLPDMCADRIEYNLHTAQVFGLMDEEKIQEIVEHLRFENKQWFFTDPLIAKEFASLSLFFTEHFWACGWNCLVQELYAKAVLRAKELGLLTSKDIHFGKDREVFEKILQSKDALIGKFLDQSLNIYAYFEEVEEGSHCFQFFPKFRGIDPKVLCNKKIIQLSSIDASYKQQYESVKKKIAKGIKYREKKLVVLKD